MFESLRLYRVAKPGGPTLANLWDCLLRYRGRVRLRFTPRKDFYGLVEGEAEAGSLSRVAAGMAEALVRKWDLKKGERALVAAEHPLEFLVLSTALARAGGIAVPLTSKVLHRAGELIRESGAALALCTPEALEEGERLEEQISSVEKKVLVGWGNGKGWESLFEETKKGSGFFIPYTLKPGNVVLLVPRVEASGRLRLVMVTNSSLFFPLRLLPLVRWISRSGKCVTRVSFSPGGTAGWTAATLGLFAGKEVFFDGVGPSNPSDTRRSLWVTDSESFSRLCQRGGDGFWPSCWIGVGSSFPKVMEGEDSRSAVAGSPATFREAFLLYDLEGWCSALALMRGTAGETGRRAKEGLIIPGNKVRLAGGNNSGEAFLRGPSLFPGYWNDLEETFRRWEEGWFRTGVFLSRKGPWVRVMGEGSKV